MSETAVSDLPPKLRQLALKARDALAHQQDDLVLELSAEILRENPGCLGVRRLQRTAHVRRDSSGPAFTRKARGAVTRAGFLLRRKKTPQGDSAIAQAEAILAVDPWSRAGLMQLAGAAAAMNLPGTAIFAWECLVEALPDDREAGLGLAQARLSEGNHAEALTAVEAVLRQHPRDGEALAVKRQVSVAATIKKGQWDSSDSFRGKLRDSEESN